jgi:hypothetical protein
MQVSILPGKLRTPDSVIKNQRLAEYRSLTEIAEPDLQRLQYLESLDLGAHVRIACYTSANTWGFVDSYVSFVLNEFIK